MTPIVPGGTVVPTVFFLGDVPCSFDLRRTLVRRGTGLRGIGLRRSCATRKRKKIHCRDGSATVALSSRQCSSLATYLARSILRETLVRRGTGVRGLSALGAPVLQGNGRRLHCRDGSATVALSSRQCSSLATYLARSIYAERWCDEGQACVESAFGAPGLQGNGRRFTAETVVPGGTVVPTVFFLGDVPCSFDLRETLVRRGTGLRGIGLRRS